MAMEPEALAALNSSWPHPSAQPSHAGLMFQASCSVEVAHCPVSMARWFGQSAPIRTIGCGTIESCRRRGVSGSNEPPNLAD
jgi:hypothetical protein